MDETFDEFRENFKLLKEKRQQQAQISKFLSPLPRTNSSNDASNTLTNDSKLSFHKLSESIEIPRTQAIKKQKSQNDLKTDISKYFRNDSKEKEEDLKCPMCSLDLNKLIESERDKHVNNCLDRKDYLNYEYKPTNKFKRGADSDNTPEKFQTTKKVDTPKTSKLLETQEDKQQQQQGEDKSKKLSESLLKDAVPNCPICGKVLHNFNIRQSHLKKCSQVFHIKTESLVELVRKQQEKIEREIAKGLIPTDVYIPKTKKSKEDKPEKKTKITNRVIKLEQPNSKQEEQLQIAIALSNSLNPVEEKQAEFKLLKGKKNDKKQAAFESVLLTTDDETRASNLSQKFATILEKQIKYVPEDESLWTKENYFVKTKFKSDKNYLWNKCKYFKETEDNFYVQVFLNTGRFIVGHQVFIDKTDQEKFANIEVINTQTAFLLADLNDQTQENLSIYYTQRLSEFNQSQFNQTQQGYQTLDSIIEDNDIENSQFQSLYEADLKEDEDEKIEIDPESKQIEDISLKNEDINISQQNFQEQEHIETSPDINESNNEIIQDIEPEGKLQEKSEDIVMSHTKPSIDLILDETVDQNDDDSIIHEYTGLNDQAVFIDETQLSSSLSEKHNSNVQNDEIVNEESSDSNDKNSNILDQNIVDESEIIEDDEPDKLIENKEKIVEVIISDESEDSNKGVRKRKSMDIIELDDSSEPSSPNKCDLTKKFKPDLVQVDEEIEIVHEEYSNNETKKNQIILNESSSSSLPSLGNHDLELNEEKDEKLEEVVVNENKDQQILDLLEKSHKFDDIPHADDALDEVWNNFSDNQYDNFCVMTYDDSIPIIDSEPVCQVMDPVIEINEKILSPSKSFRNQQDNSDEDICEFIKNYSENQNKKGVEKNKSQNSTLDEEDLETLEVDRFEKPKEKKKDKKIDKPAPSKEPTAPILKPSITLPNFSSMDTPDLKSELKKFGVKALPKKQAVKKLTEIYEFTSRKQQKSSFVRSQSCMNFKTTSSQMKTSNSITGISSKVNVKSDLEDDDLDSMAKIMNLESLTQKQTKKVSLKKTVSDIGSIRSQSTQSSGLIKIGAKKNKKDKNLECTLDDRMLEMVEESDDDDNSEASEASSTQKKSGKILKEKVKKTLDEDETRQCVFNLLKSDDILYLSVLNYEPLDYEQFFTSLQTSLAPRKCNNKILMKILDEYCVTFTLKNLNTRGGASKLRSKKKH